MISKVGGMSNPVLGIVRCLVIGILSSVLAGATIIFPIVPAAAKPEFSAQTKLPCGQCHANPAGGGKLKTFGEKFKANGNKL